MSNSKAVTTNRTSSSAPSPTTSHATAKLPTAERDEPEFLQPVEAAGATKINRRSNMNMLVRTAIAADQNSQRRAAGDERLWSLYDKFERAYFRVNELDTPASRVGSLSSATPKEKKAQNQWARAADAAFRAARRVLAEPALTGDGLLMKIHVAGFEFDAARGTFTMPYEGASTPQWSPSGLSNDECAFIKSIGADLRRAREALR